jgi:hypothetical protein
VSLLHVDGRFRPSDSVPSSTLYAFARASFWTSSRVGVACLLVNGHADAPEKRHSDATKTWIIMLPVMFKPYRSNEVRALSSYAGLHVSHLS